MQAPLLPSGCTQSVEDEPIPEALPEPSPFSVCVVLAIVGTVTVAAVQQGSASLPWCTANTARSSE